MNSNAVIFFGGSFVLLVVAASLIALSRGLGLLAFCCFPVAAALPWLAVLLMVGLTIESLPQDQQQAWGMSGLFPGLAGTFLVPVTTIFSFFFFSKEPLTRFWWGLGINGVPALLLGAFLLFVRVTSAT